MGKLKAEKYMLRRKSQAIVEMALVLPLFLFIFVTIIDGARIMNLYSNLSRLANLGAAHATAVNRHLNRPGPDEVREFILSRVLPPLNTAVLKNKDAIRVEPPFADHLGLRSARVILCYPLPLSSPFLTPILGRHHRVEVQAILPYSEN